jgi:hypothetical protein
MAKPSLELVQTMVERLLDGQRRMMDVLADHADRLTSLDKKVALLHSEIALHGDFAGQSLRIDRIEQRLDRIERRLNLVTS